VTAATVSRPTAAAGAWIRAGCVAAGLLILLVRPSLAATSGWTVPVVIGVFTAVLLLGVAPPVPVDQPRAEAGRPAMITISAFVAGAMVFGLGRLISAGHPPAPATATVVVLSTLAAIAEEALFRRAAFAALLPAGPFVAVTGSALLFGLAHVTVYGWWAFPLDVAAGVVLGWQRWASGSWLVPAATHALADLLVVI
jgi:membrane protease YdiL (CAAX protease family)